jgi:type I restriction enzyme M protein
MSAEPERTTRKQRTDPRLSRADVRSGGLTINALESWLWDAACAIRGAVDAPKFKDYILPLIFIKRLSDVFDDEIDRLGEKFGDQEVALTLADEDHSLVRFYIPAEASWAEIRKLTVNLGQSLTQVMRAVTKANPTLRGVIDIVDFNATVSGQRIIEDGRLSTLIEILSRHRLGLEDVEPDLFGRAYEYLLRKFAEGQGQSAGEFFTPKEVGWLIARLLRAEEGMSIYDPACGSAGLLIKAELTVKESVDVVKRPLQLYGQELNHVTYAIAKMNMIIHDMEGEIVIGDTFRSPKFLHGSRLATFDLVAANPMWNQDGFDAEFYDADHFDRFTLGFAPASTADWGWVQHMLASLNVDGRAVIVLDTGAVSRGSGGKGSNRERDIRKQLVDRDLIEGIIALPENLFYNTSAPGILVCLNRSKHNDRRGKILLINASKEFKKGRPKNFIPDESITKIATAFGAGHDIPSLLRTITNAEAAKNDYNLSPNRYISLDGADEPLTMEDAIVLLKEAEEERAVADGGFDEAMEKLGFGAWRHG